MWDVIGILLALYLVWLIIFMGFMFIFCCVCWEIKSVFKEIRLRKELDNG